MKILSKAVIAVQLLALIFAVGCGSSNGGSGWDATSVEDTAIYDATLATTPSFKAVGTASISASKEIVPEWESGNPLFEVFQLLRDFNPETDQGVIDTSNLYKTLFETRGFVDRTKGNCESVVEQVISSPFDFGNEERTYNCAFNELNEETGYDFGGAIANRDDSGELMELLPEMAISETETVTPTVQHGIFGFVWVDGHSEYGVVEGLLNTVTSDLALDIAVWVDYEGDMDYCYRNDIDGNADTKQFTLRSAKGNLAEESTGISILAAGQAEGEDGHILLKIATESISDRYYCIGSEDGEAELMAMDPEGSEAVPEDCSEYQAAVDSMEHLGSDGLLCSADVLNQGAADPEVVGTVMLDIE